MNFTLRECEEFYDSKSIHQSRYDQVIASKKKGMTRNEILEQTGLANAGSTTRILEELEQYAS